MKKDLQFLSLVFTFSFLLIFTHSFRNIFNSRFEAGYNLNMPSSALANDNIIELKKIGAKKTTLFNPSWLKILMQEGE